MKKIVLALLLLLAGLPTAASALSYGAQDGAAVSLMIVPMLHCGGSQCSNEWNECFNPEPNSQGIVNIDTMAAVGCARAEDA